MQCPVCLKTDKFKKKIKLKTQKTPIVNEPNHTGGHDVVHRSEHDYVDVGLDFQKYKQLYADICTNCGTVVRLYYNRW